MFNGPHSSSPVIGKYTGQENPGSIGPSMINKVLVTFQSDASNNEKGFSATFTSHTRGTSNSFLIIRTKNMFL